MTASPATRLKGNNATTHSVLRGWQMEGKSKYIIDGVWLDADDRLTSRLTFFPHVLAVVSLWL